MKFFKHFTNGHDSTAMTTLIDKHGLEAYAAYFIIMELGIAKIEKQRDHDLALDDCKFTIHGRILRQKLRMRATKVELLLNSCATLTLLNFSRVEDEFNFDVPKILEFFDRDTKRARHERAVARPKNKIKKKNNTLPTVVAFTAAPTFDFESIYEKYPRKIGKQEGLKRLRARGLNDKDFVDLSRAVTAYAAQCRRLKTDEKYIKHFDSFVGTNDKEPWRDFITEPIAAPPPVFVDIPSGGSILSSDVRPDNADARKAMMDQVRGSLRLAGNGPRQEGA